MGIFNRKRSQKARDKPREDGRPDVYAMDGIPRTRADLHMQTHESVYAAVCRIATTIAAMPLHLYKGNEIQWGHRLDKLVSYAPNANMTGYMHRLTMQGCVGNEGNAYSLIVPDGLGGVSSLDVLKPQYVTPMRARETGNIWYYVRPEDGGMPMWIHNSQMIVIRNISTNGERGVRPMDVLTRTLEYDQKIKEFSLDQLDGVSGNGVMLAVPGVGISDDRVDVLIDRFLERYKKSRRSVVVLEGGITASSINRSPVDAKVMDVERISKNRVATAYLIPPHMLGDYSDTSYSTAEQSMLEFMTLTMQTHVAQWEDELERKLLTYEQVAEGYHFRFDMEAMHRSDTLTMATKHQMAIRGGWMSPNEVRNRDGLPDDPAGNELLVSRDLLPLHMVRNGKTL